MPIHKRRDRRGRVRIYVDKQWPDGKRFRRVMPNMTVAKNVLGRIEGAIATGSWTQLRTELEHGQPREWNPTVEEFSRVYLEEYCRTRNRRPDFKEYTLTDICRVLGQVRMREFRRSDAHRYIQTRSREVAPATVNRGVAVLRNMLTFAIERDLIEMHPLLRFRMLPEPEKALRVLTGDELASLVTAAHGQSEVLGVFVEVLAETGLRKSEALGLKWMHIQTGTRKLTVDHTKNGKVRHIPLTERSLGALHRLVRYLDDPHVFVLPQTGKRWHDPREAFERARARAGLGWVGFHDLRHYRATQWVKHGMPLREVQAYLGHADIHTTMRYAHFAPDHALETARRIEEIERSGQEEPDDNWTTTRADWNGNAGREASNG